MRLLFIRHAEPDYSRDSLTEKGWREAALLSKIAPSLQMGSCYVSPLGRAQKTAAGCLVATGKSARTLPWLEEFDAPLDLNLAPELAIAYPGVKPEPTKGSLSAASPWDAVSDAQPGRYRLRCPWDIGPRYYAAHPELTDPVGWRESDIYKNSLMPRRYDEVAGEFDKLLASHGYVHENGLYRVERESRETLTFFCHFGITCVLLSVLWNVSPFFLWQSLVMLPSTVTELISEEREEGAALFRAQRIGDQSHLYAGSETPSFFARFCEIYSDFSAETGRH